MKTIWYFQEKTVLVNLWYFFQAELVLTIDTSVIKLYEVKDKCV